MNHKWKKTETSEGFKETHLCETCGCRREMFYCGKQKNYFYIRSKINFNSNRPDCIYWHEENNKTID